MSWRTSEPLAGMTSVAREFVRHFGPDVADKQAGDSTFCGHGAECGAAAASGGGSCQATYRPPSFRAASSPIGPARDCLPPSPTPQTPTLPTAHPHPDLPERDPRIGEMIRVRTRRWLVKEVTPPPRPASPPESALPAPTTTPKARNLRSAGTANSTAPFLTTSARPTSVTNEH